MHVDPKSLTADESYKLMTGVVVPRPVAWVTTLSPTGGVNLAPFSTFTFVSPKPPMLAFSVGHKAGVYKDTARNILANEDYVVHIADRPLMEMVHKSAVEYPPEVSETETLGLATEPSLHVRPPRVKDAPIAMECRLRQCLEFGETRSRLIVGEVVAFHFRDGLMKNGKIDTAALDPLCRLAGPNYATLGEIVTMQAIFQTPKGLP
jgi:flavin reductase (DIM6/NTAB) family NADH-FMN oxidoreductase RutF